MKFRVAAGQIQPADVFRQSRVAEGAEKDHLCPGVPEGLQRLGVDKAERLVLRHGDADAGRRLGSFFRQGGRLLFAEGQQAGPVDVLLHRVGQKGQLLL